MGSDPFTKNDDRFGKILTAGGVGLIVGASIGLLCWVLLAAPGIMGIIIITAGIGCAVGVVIGSR